RDSWRTVRTVDAMIRTNLNAGIFSMVPAATGFARVPESLLLVFAVSVLEDTLRQLRDEGEFCSRDGLGRLMKASQAALPWRDFAGVNKVIKRRNDIAHRRKFLGPGQCVLDLKVLAQELSAWHV